MGFGGGGGGPMFGGGRPCLALPVGGPALRGASPPSSRPGSTSCWPRSPTTASPTVAFSQHQSANERRTLTLRGLLLEHPHMLAGSAILVVAISLAHPSRARSSPSSPSTTACCRVTAT